jgi:hypothetical protein
MTTNEFLSMIAQLKRERDRTRQLLVADAERVDAYLGVCTERDEARTELELWRDGNSDNVDRLVKELESRGLGWDLGNQGRLIEARVWDWPYVIGRYRPAKVEPLSKMLATAMQEVDWDKYPVKEKSGHETDFVTKSEEGGE